MKDKNFSPRITCPNCGCQYLPAEIYIPKNFFGNPVEVEREATSGKIQYFFGSDMDLEEKYICDRCGQPFKVKAFVRFNTEGTNFNEDYSTTLKKNTLFLSED